MLNISDKMGRKEEIKKEDLIQAVVFADNFNARWTSFHKCRKILCNKLKFEASFSHGADQGGPGGMPTPPWVSDTWKEENKLYNSTSFYCKQKTCCYLLFKYNKIIHYILIKGESVTWRKIIKKRLKSTNYQSMRYEFTVH